MTDRRRGSNTPPDLVIHSWRFVCGCGTISRVEGDGGVNTASPAAGGTTSQRIQRPSENRVNKTVFLAIFEETESLELKLLF